MYLISVVGLIYSSVEQANKQIHVNVISWTWRPLLSDPWY